MTTRRCCASTQFRSGTDRAIRCRHLLALSRSTIAFQGRVTSGIASCGPYLIAAVTVWRGLYYFSLIRKSPRGLTRRAEATSDSDSFTRS